ncbi:MAG: endonuclease NucS, partial [bacterium]|nr:endonuclease NucS [bacterium]
MIIKGRWQNETKTLKGIFSMLESVMEELISKYPSEFFPRKSLTLTGRQRSFSGVGRFDLMFQDEHKTNILMELKARPAKYEDASQLAKYNDALKIQGVSNILMWLVATDIPNSVREFLDRIGIEYTEIHESEYRIVAVRHNEIIDKQEEQILI